MTIVQKTRDYGTLVVVDPADYHESELRYWWLNKDLAAYLYKCVGQPIAEDNFIFVTLASPDTALFALVDNELLMPNPRAYTEVELRRLFLTHLSHLCDYWNTVKEHDALERLRGLTHSILALLDGSCVGLPGWNLTPYPHEDDLEYYTSLGENYFPADVNIADGNLAFKFYNNEITDEEISAFLDTNPIECAVRIDLEGEVMPGARIGKFIAKVTSVDKLPCRIADKEPNKHIIATVVRSYVESNQRNIQAVIESIDFKEDHVVVTGDLKSKPILGLGKETQPWNLKIS